jgi:hypothetical protein
MAVTVHELLAAEYQQRRDTASLREQVFGAGATGDVLAQLAIAEAALVRIEKERAAAETAEGPDEQVTLGVESTKLEATFTLRMAQIPTSIYHLFDVTEDPLVSGSIANKTQNVIRRLRVTAYLDGYSAAAVDTLEIRAGRSGDFALLPTLFPDRIRDLVELTRGTLNLLIEDIATTGIELHRTTPVWLLPRTTAPLAVRDPKTGTFHDLTRYLGAYVTPNDPAVMAFLRNVANHHPDRQLIGYQGTKPEDVTSQIRAIFEALKADAGISYVNSVISFSPEDATSTQRVRLPSESLHDHLANCIDGTVLVASVIEAASMNAAIVVVPGHAFVGWESGMKTDSWDYLETTMIGTEDFDVACAHARQLATTYETLATQLGDANRFRRWSIRDLRGQRITPLQ